MTINLADNSPRISYTVAEGVTQTSFAVPFEFFDNGDLNVYIDGTLKTLTTDYTVTGGDGSTGTVSMSVTGGTGGSTVVITRDIALERTTDFPVSGAFNIVALNTELDRLVAVAADLDDRASRALQLTDFDAAVSLVLPEVDTRKGKTLAFNASTGAVEAGPSISDTQTVSAASADIALLADIQDGTTATNAITTVASNNSNVTTVAGISANVTTVAGISSDVTAVAADATDIGTVATNIASVNTVATNIADVITVANDLTEAVSEVETVANDLNEAVSEIDTVAGSITNVDTVGSGITNVNTVATNISNVNTVAGISANVTTVAGDTANIGTIATDLNGSDTIGSVATNISNVNSVAGNASNINSVAGNSTNINAVAGNATNINTVAADATDIGTVATDIANVNTVAGNNTNINTVAGISSNVTTVAGISSNVTTVAGISSDVTAVANDSSDIGTVASGITNINTVAGSITNVNTVATNISGVNSFAERYRVGSSDPTTSLDAGDLAFNTTDNGFKFYDGSQWQTVNVSGIGSLAEDTTPQLGGNLDVNSNDITGTGNVNITGNITASGTVSGSNIPENVLTATASGALSNGDVVSLNSDGTVSSSGDVVIPSSAGSITGASNHTNSYYFSTTWISDTQFLYLYTHNNDTYVKLGTVSGTTISYGTPVLFSGNQHWVGIAYDSANGVAVGFAANSGNTSIPFRVITVSGSTISLGSITYVTGKPTWSTLDYDANSGKIVFFFKDGNNSSYPTVALGTVSGTSISFGTSVVFDTNYISVPDSVIDTTNNKLVFIGNRGADSNYISARVGEISGTTVNFNGSWARITTMSIVDAALECCYDSTSQKVVVTWSNTETASSSVFQAAVGTVSGDAISFGTINNFYTSDDSSDTLKFTLFSPLSNKILTATLEWESGGLGTVKLHVGTISGTTISYATGVSIKSLPYFWGSGEQYIKQNDEIRTATNKIVIPTWGGSSTSTDATFIYQYTYTQNNANNYIGIANAAYSDGATATIQVLGSIDDAQSGLTTGTSYFVADDGSLSATNNGRKIGKATSATEILIDTAMTGSEMNAYLGGLV